MPDAPSLYRRHRPRTFSQVVGQEHVVRTLRNAVEHGKVHHAYLFVGSRGTGKTSMAKILATCLNCEQGPTIEPCLTCDSCRSIMDATSLDVIEMDAASNNSVDDIRDLRDSVAFAPVSGGYKVYILDEAHMLSPQAWNAFLKTLEEPPPHTIFVLATTEANKVLPTVVDRCHRFDFVRPTVDQIAGVLRRVAEEEGIEIGPDAVALLARHATGSFRDALGTLEQLVTYSGRRIATEDVLAVLGVADADLLFAALDAIARADARAALHAAAQLSATGRDASAFVKDLEAHARDLLVVQALGEVPAELRVTPDRDARLADQAARIGRAAVARVLDLLAEALEAMKNGADPRTRLELALVKAAAPEADSSTAALSTRIERLEAALAARGPAPVAPAPPQGQPPAATPPQAAPALQRQVARPPVAAEQPEPAYVPPPPEPTYVPEPKEPQRTRMPDAPHRPPGPERTQVPEPPAPAGPERTQVPEPPAPPGPERTQIPDDPERTHVPEPSEPTHVPEPTEVPRDAGPAAAIAVAEPATLDAGALTEAWPAVLEQVGRENPLCAGVLAQGRPLSFADGTLTVAFPPGADFARRQAAHDDHKKCLGAALRAVTGGALRVEYVLREASPEGGGGAPAVTGPDPLGEDEVLERLMREFGAEEIDPEAEEQA